MPDRAAIKVSVRVHPELWEALKISCVRKRCTLAQEVHRLLCREYARADLEADAPRGHIIPATPAGDGPARPVRRRPSLPEG